MKLRQWIEARIAALPEDAFDSLDDWPENADAFDANLPDNFETALEPTLVHLEYRDAQGEVSERPVTLLQMRGTGKGPVHLIGRCHMRNARRNFRFDRVLSVSGLPGLPGDASPKDALIALADLAIAPRPNTASPLAATPPGRPKAASSAAMFKVIRRNFRAELRLLAFLAKADGELHPAEIDAISGYARSLLPEHSRKYWTPDDNAALSAYLRNLKYAAETERLCLSQLQLWDEDLERSFAHAITRVMEADGKRHASELAMIRDWNIAPSSSQASGGTDTRPAPSADCTGIVLIAAAFMVIAVIVAASLLS